MNTIAAQFPELPTPSAVLERTWRATWFVGESKLDHGIEQHAVYTADQMRAYARAALAAPRQERPHPDALPDGTLSKSTAKRVEALRLAQGEALIEHVTDHLCEQEYDIGGREELRQHVADALATQPLHQDRGEVEPALLRVAEVLPPRPLGQFIQPGFVMSDKHCRELHARFESLSATITAALTEAKQQGPGEGMLLVKRTDAECLVRDAERFIGENQGTAGGRLARKRVRALLTAPQVEAKRQTGEGESPSLKRIIPAALPYPKPDQVTGADTGSIGEHAYADGWNDCRKAMIAAAAKPSGED